MHCWRFEEWYNITQEDINKHGGSDSGKIKQIAGSDSFSIIIILR